MFGFSEGIVPEAMKNKFKIGWAVWKAMVAISVVLSFMFFVKNDKLRYLYSDLDWDGRENSDIPYTRNALNRLIGINSQGFRDFEYAINKPADSLRIIVVGDSVTFGDGLSLEDTYVKQLERLLRKALNKQVEVLNFGASGASTINELELIERKILVYRPDILILQMDPNDSQIIHQIRKRDPYLNKIILELKKNNSEVCRWLKYKLEFYKYYRYLKHLTPEEEYNNIAIPLDGIIDYCKENNIKLAIFSYDPSYRSPTYEKIMLYIMSKKIPLLDLAKTGFHELSYKDKYVNGAVNSGGMALDGHPNKNGSRVVAEELASFLETIPGYLK